MLYSGFPTAHVRDALAAGSSFQMSITHFQPIGSLRQIVTTLPCTATGFPSGPGNVNRFLPTA